MMHFYTTARWDRSRGCRTDKTVKLLCTKVFAEPQIACTVPHNVTCPDCLRILIPKLEANLMVMRNRMQILDKKAEESCQDE